MALTDLKVGRLSFIDYRMGLKNFPIPTIDFVVIKNHEFLLIKRKEGAYAGQWFVPGGRQERGEKMLDALGRIASREIGLKPEDVISRQFSHCQDVFNHESANSEGGLPAWHSIWHFFKVEVFHSFEPMLDSTSSEYRWFTLGTLPEVSVPQVVLDALIEATVIHV